VIDLIEVNFFAEQLIQLADAGVSEGKRAFSWFVHKVINRFCG
jgi:hypothetical protein